MITFPLLFLLAADSQSKSPWPIILAFVGPLGVFLTAYVTWMVAKRKSSGTVQTSESGELWEAWSKLQAAADQLREDMAAELITVREENKMLRGEVDTLKAEIRTLRDKVRNLERHS